MSDVYTETGTGEMSVTRQVAKQRANSVPLPRLVLRHLGTALVYLFLILMSIFALFPIYYVLQASFGGNQNLYSTDLRLLPPNFTFDNYIYAFTNEPLLSWLVNTFFVCAASTLIGVVFSATGAYALSRFRFRGRELSLTLLLAIQAFPALLALSAYYLLLQALNLNNSLIGLLLIYTAGSLAFSTWNIKGYFDTLPVELEQAAMIDGASLTRAFVNITLPLAAPSLAASALFMFIGSWNEFAIANLVLNANDTGSNLTFAVGLYNLQGDFRTPWGIFAATSVIISLPLAIVFLYMQRYFQSGLTVGSVKG